MRLEGLDRPFVFAFVATLALSFKGILAKFAYAAGANVDFLLVIRFLLAAPLFWIGVRLIDGRWGLPSIRQWLYCGAAGVLFFCATYADFTAISLIEVGLSRVILFTFPALVVLLSALLQRRPPRALHLLSFLVTYAGLYLVIRPDPAQVLSAQALTGILWSFSSALFYAVYLLLSQQLMKGMGSALFTAASGTMTLLVMLLFSLVDGRFATMEYSLPGFGWSALIALFCTLLPFFLLYEAIRRFGATNASLVTLSGPAMTLISAWLLLDETLVPVQLLGFLVTLAGLSILEAERLSELLRRVAGRRL